MPDEMHPKVKEMMDRWAENRIGYAPGTVFLPEDHRPRKGEMPGRKGGPQKTGKGRSRPAGGRGKTKGKPSPIPGWNVGMD